MVQIKVVVFDFIGTLADLVGYSLEKSKEKMYRSLVANRIKVAHEAFFDAYERAHQKYREIRYGKFVEVTNAVWISEALNHLGYSTTPEDGRVRVAVNVFFEGYLKALRLRRSAKSTLQKLSQNYKLGIISNYTHTPLIYAGLRKLKISDFFNAVLVSEEVGWRKPSPRIFQEALRRMRVKAEETVYVGDTPLEDVEGAKRVGMKTVFIPSQFNNIGAMRKASQQPDYVIGKLSDLLKILDKNEGS